MDHVHLADMTLHVLVWLALSLATLPPILVLLRRQNLPLLPTILYGVATYIFQILGIVFLVTSVLPGSGRDLQLGASYLVLMLVSLVPIYLMLVIRTPDIGQDHTQPTQVVAGKIVWILLWMISAAAVAHYWRTVGAPPVLRALGLEGSAAFYNVRREIVSRGIYDDYTFVFYTIAPMAGLLGHYLYRYDALSIGANLLSLTAAFGCAGYFLLKGHIVLLLVGILVVESFVRTFSWRTILASGGVGGVGLVATYLVYMGNLPMDVILESMLNRIVAPHLSAVDFIVHEMPGSHDLFYGHTFPNPRNLFGFEPVSLSGFLMGQISGGSGALPAPAMAGWYANFGWLGVGLGCLMISGWLIVLAKSTGWAMRTPVRSVVWVMFALGLINLAKQEFFVAVDLRFILAAAALIGIEWLIAEMSRERLHTPGFPASPYGRAMSGRPR